MFRRMHIKLAGPIKFLSLSSFRFYALLHSLSYSTPLSMLGALQPTYVCLGSLHSRTRFFNQFVDKYNRLTAITAS